MAESTGDQVDRIIGEQIDQDIAEQEREKQNTETVGQHEHEPLNMHVPEWWDAWQRYVANNRWLELADVELWSRVEKTWAVAWNASKRARQSKIVQNYDEQAFALREQEARAEHERRMAIEGADKPYTE